MKQKTQQKPAPQISKWCTKPITPSIYLSVMYFTPKLQKYLHFFNLNKKQKHCKHKMMMTVDMKMMKVLSLLELNLFHLIKEFPLIS